ncbi:DUF4333 domain-containing protein [Blastococcus sp. TF02A-30]|uniref:DUF4333 domain-containing protein n=1 Tax=Blastococcus sp. TF02A-30 TaxID=2250580 RepID=UPI000DEA7C5C|nr:DUF4333 domain-containing protein [Blastococcus sp. TF02A-30]RBY84042.1 hypothetical protein DQ241_18430 [Blastococcus sp. TF02A-30]
MRRRLRLRVLVASSAALPAVLLAGCASGALSSAEVASSAEDALESEVGVRPDVRCEEGLEREEGASTRCTLTAEDDDVEYGVTVTVTDTGEGARLQVEVDDGPIADGSEG